MTFRNLKEPRIVTDIPGPKIKKFLELTGPIFPKYSQPIVDEAEGIFIKDPDENIFIDFISSRCVVNIGHNHPKLVQALQQQITKSIFGLTEKVLYMIMKLNQITPGNYQKTVLCGQTGSSMNDLAIKYSRGATGRSNIISFAGSYHGVTYGALSMSSFSKAMFKGFGPMLPGIYQMPYANCYRCIFGSKDSDCDLNCLRYMTDIAFKSYLDPEEVAGIVFEPIQGDAGWYVPPNEWFSMLKEICRDNNILMIAEEIQSGFGRTGKWFAVEHWNLIPDILLLGKSLGGGIPSAAAVIRGNLDLPEGGGRNSSLLNTVSYNPLSTISSIANIEIIEQENLVQNSANLGDYAKKRLQEMMKNHPSIGDVRGRGLMIGLDIVEDKISKKPNIKCAEKIVDEAFKRGLYIMHMGSFGTAVIRLAPPLIINKEQMDSSLNILEDSITEAES